MTRSDSLDVTLVRLPDDSSAVVGADAHRVVQVIGLRNDLSALLIGSDSERVGDQ